MADSFICPHCGGEVKPKALACPHCGSDKSTGWADPTQTDDDYEFSEEDYQDAVRTEFGPARQRFGLRSALTAGIIIVVLALFIIYLVK